MCHMMTKERFVVRLEAMERNLYLLQNFWTMSGVKFVGIFTRAKAIDEEKRPTYM